MKYILRTTIERGQADTKYVRVQPLGASGLLVSEVVLGITGAELLSGDYATQSPEDTEVPDLETLVASGIAKWSKISQNIRFGQTATLLAEKRAPDEYLTEGGLVVFDPRLAVNDPGEFIGFDATPQEIEAIFRIGTHVTDIAAQSQGPAAPGTGNYL